MQHRAARLRSRYVRLDEEQPHCRCYGCHAASPPSHQLDCFDHLLDAEAPGHPSELQPISLCRLSIECEPPRAGLAVGSIPKRRTFRERARWPARVVLTKMPPCQELIFDFCHRSLCLWEDDGAQRQASRGIWVCEFDGVPASRTCKERRTVCLTHPAATQVEWKSAANRSSSRPLLGGARGPNGPLPCPHSIARPGGSSLPSSTTKNTGHKCGTHLPSMKGRP